MVVRERLQLNGTQVARTETLHSHTILCRVGALATDHVPLLHSPPGDTMFCDTPHGVTLRLLVTLALTSSLALGCGETDEPSSDDALHALPTDLGDPGKFDNYISTNAREFELAGTAHVILPDNWDTLDADARSAELTSLIDRRLSSVSRAVKGRVDDIVDESNGGISGEDAKYFTYFRRDNAMSGQAMILEDEPGGRAAFDFEMEFVGSTRIMSVLAPDDGGARSFSVEVSDWGSTNVETIDVVIQGSDSRDAFPKYDELFADGVFDIAVHFGGDYNEERFDLETAQWLTETLIEDGWENEEVTDFDSLGIDSPPFTREVIVEGEKIEIQVSIVHSDMVEETEEARLSDAMKQSLREADVVIYSGHAGPDAGFILDYQPRHEIDNDEFPTLELTDKYQIYVFDGCQTYRTYVDDLMANPNKTFDSVDIVTTVNTTPFSVGYQVLWEFLYWFTFADQYGNHQPLSWKTILRGINTEDFDDVHYGVHGIDSDPQLNPHASEGVGCAPCSSDNECFAGGNLCLGYPEGGRCGIACTNDAACPDGYRCARLTDIEDEFWIAKQCVRRDLTCE